MSNRKSNVTPGSSPSTSKPQTNQTQVFILRPEILKKLGITAQIPNLQSVTTNVSSEKNTTLVKKATTTKANINNKPKETETNQKDGDKTDEIVKTVTTSSKKVFPVPKIRERVKQKQIRLENLEDAVEIKEAEEKSTKPGESKANGNTSTKHNDETSVKEINNITSLMKSKLLAKLNQKLDVKEIRVEKKENVKRNKMENKLPETTSTKRPSTSISINKSVEKNIIVAKDDSLIKMEDTPSQIPATKQPAITTKSLKKQLKQNISSPLAMEMELSEPESRESIEKEQSSLPPKKQIKEDTTSTPDTKMELTKPDLIKSVKKQQRSTRNSVAEENATLSSSDQQADTTPVRKSGRKRKMSNLHDDFVTELKLHDGNETNRKKVAKTRKSMDSTMTNLQDSTKEMDELKQKPGKKIHLTQDAIETDNILQTKPVIIRTYSRIKKTSQNDTSLQQTEKCQTITNTGHNSSISKHSDENIIEITGATNTEITSTIETKITKSDNGLENSDSQENENKNSKRKSISKNDSEEINKSTEISLPSKESMKKNKIKILEIKTIEKSDRINTEQFSKLDSDTSMDGRICQNNSDVISTSEICTKSTEDSVQEAPCDKSESLPNESVNNNPQLSEIFSKSDDAISNIEKTLESTQNMLNNSESISKTEPTDTSIIKEVSSKVMSDTSTSDTNITSVVTNTDKQNEIINDMENRNIRNDKLVKENADNTVKTNEIEETTKNLSDISENLKPKKDTLNEITDDLSKQDVLNEINGELKTTEKINESVVKCKNKSELKTSENISKARPRNSSIVHENQKLNTEEVNRPDTSNVQDKMLQSVIKSEKSPIVEQEVQNSFSTKSSIITSTPIVQKRPGRSRKSNVKLEESNIENNNSKSLVYEQETTNMDTTVNSTLQNSILDVSEIHSETPVKKRPGRPRKTPLVQEKIKIENSDSIQEEITDISSALNVADDSQDEDEFLVRRKRGRPKKIREIISDNEEEEEQGDVEESRNLENDESVTENKPKSRRGRKRKVDISEEEMNRNKPIISAGGLVQCAVCKAEVKNTGWVNHCAKHNFLTWRVGEQEINVQDRAVVSSILYKAIKGRKHVFTCETCGDKKKSVVGYLSHLDQCQKTKEEIANMRVACTICGRLMQPVSLKVHMALHNDKAKVEINPEELTIDTKRKRQAAKKAVGLIQEVTQEENDRPVKKLLRRKSYKKVADGTKLLLLGGLNQSLRLKIEKTGAVRCQIKSCTYETKNIDELKEHFNSCPELKTADIVCCYCLHVTEDETEMIQHVKKNHFKNKEDDSDHENEKDIYEEDDEEEFEPDDDEVLEKRVRTVLTVTQRKYTYKIDFLAREKRMLPSLVCTYPATIKWTMEFVRENYADKQLFSNYKSLESDWTLLAEDKYRDYMPELKKSMCVQQVVIKHTIPCLQRKEYSWKEYDLFESDIREDTATIFCGGPVWSLAWAPTPVDLEVDQILAVSIQKNPDKTYKMSQAYSSEGMIQFWNFGTLKNTKQFNKLPSLEFCLLHNHGMIWHMEWCPSGCYDEEDSNGLRRMGLLAVACSDGNIVIYSIHFPGELQKSNGPKMVKPKEMFKLIAQSPSEQRLGLWDFQATKLSWTKARGHNILAGGYSNGMVCLFNLQADSPICKSEEDGVTILTPYLTFHPHCAVITALSLHPLNGGARWLVTGSWDRSCKYWDLKDISAPITAYVKRGLITDGVWMTHWLCSFLTYDDVFNLSHTVTTIQNVRDYSYKQTSALATNSMITSISASDWANSIVQGSLAGELTGSFPRQLLISFDVDKGLKCKRVIFGYSELVEKNLAPAERLKKIKIKGNNKKDVDFSDKDDKYIFKYFMNKDKEEFDEEPVTYHEAQKKYGLVFCDFKLDTYSQIPSDALSWVRQSNRMHEAPLELYPLMAINRVQWNPNKQAHLYLATGHQTGFVRLKCVRFMNTKF